jgi:DNA repair protein RecO (recombination protein O)
MIQRVGEAIVLRTWPFLEADLLVSLFTREQGRIKGVARHALRSRKRFGGALEPMTYVRATYAERPRQELVRLDSFEILSSPLAQPVDYARTAALQLIAEVLEEALPEQAAEDTVFRLALSTLAELEVNRIWLPVTYFCLWMNRLMGWMPELGHCVVCGAPLRRGALIEGASGMAGSEAFGIGSGPTTRSGQVWYSPTSDGVTCPDDRRPGSLPLSAIAVETAQRIFRVPIRDLATEDWPPTRVPDLRRFALETLERHLDHRLQTARALHRL